MHTSLLQISSQKLQRADAFTSGLLAPNSKTKNQDEHLLRPGLKNLIKA